MKMIFQDEKIMLLVFYLKSSPHTVTIPMKWKHMRDFLRDWVIGKVGLQKGMIQIYGTESAVEGLPDEQSISMIEMESIAAWRIFEPQPDESEEDKLRKRALDIQERAAKAAEKLAGTEEQGEEWKNSGKDEK